MALLVRFAPQLIVVGALLGGAWWFSHVRYEAGYAAAEGLWQAQTQEAAERFAEELGRQQALLLRADGALAAERRNARQGRDQLDETFRTDPVAGDWAGQPIPASVQIRLGRPAVPGDPADSARAVPAK